MNECRRKRSISTSNVYISNEAAKCEISFRCNSYYVGYKFPFAAICTDIYVNAVNTVNVGDYLVNTRYPMENIPNVLCCVRNRMYAADALIGMDFER